MCEKTSYSHTAAVGGGPAPSPALSQPISVQPESLVANSPHSVAGPPPAALQRAPHWERDRYPAALEASLLQDFKNRHTDQR